MSQTIYARVPDHVKEATDAYATTSGLTLAGAVSELLDRGLQAVSDADSVAELRQTVSGLRMQVEALEEREHRAASANQGLAQRLARRVGNCPACGAEITGQDLLIAGHCPKPDCGENLANLFAPVASTAVAPKGALNDTDFKMLLGALGLALGIALLSQGGKGVN